MRARYLAPWMETSDSYVVGHGCGDAAAELPFDVQVNPLHAISRRAWKCGLKLVNRFTTSWQHSCQYVTVTFIVPNVLVIFVPAAAAFTVTVAL